MAGANRRIILAPAGLGEEVLARLHEQLVRAVEQQNRLATRSAHILQFTSAPQRTAFGLTVEHEPAEPLGLKDLFDPEQLPAGHDAAEQKRLLRIAAGLFDALRVAHEGVGEANGSSAAGGLRSAIIHGGLCPGTVLTSPEGIVKITDFGFARAVCGVLGPESYLNLAVGSRSGGSDEPGASGLWEVLTRDVPGRDDRISAFIDPQVHGTQQYNVFEASQDIIAAGFLLYLLAEHRHPYFYTDPEAHRDVDVAAQMMPAMPPARLHRKSLNEESPNPAMKLWCRLVDRMVDRLPQERPTAGHLAEELGRFEPPVGMGDILARRLDALCGELSGAALEAVPWEAIRDRGNALGGGAGQVSGSGAGVSEQARAIVQLCDAAQVLYGPEWRSAGRVLGDLATRGGVPEAVGQKAREAAQVLQGSLAVEKDLAQIEADLQRGAGAESADALGPLQRAAGQLDGLIAGRKVLPSVAGRAAALTQQVQEKRRAAEARLQALTEGARQWLGTVEAALQAGQWDEVERLLGQPPPIPSAAGGIQARAEAITAQLRAQRAAAAARRQRQAALERQLRDAEAALGREAFKDVRALLEVVQKQEEFADLAATAGQLRQRCDDQEREVLRRQRQAALERQLQDAEAALGREAFQEVRTLLEPVQKQEEFADLAATAGQLRQRCDDQEREVLRRQRQAALERQLQEAEAALGREAFEEVRALLEVVQKQEEFADLAAAAGQLRQQCDEQEREVLRGQRQTALERKLQEAEAALGREAFQDVRTRLEPVQKQEEFADLAAAAGQLRQRCDDQEREVLQRQEALRQARAQADKLLAEAQKRVEQDTASSLEQAATLAGQALDLAQITPEQRGRGEQLRSRIEQRLHAIHDEEQRRAWLLQQAQGQLQAASNLLAEGRVQDSQAKAEPLAKSDLPEVRKQAEQILARIGKAIAEHRSELGRQLAAAREAVQQGRFEAAAGVARQVQEDPLADDALRDGARQVIGAIARTQLEAYRAGLARQLEQAAEHIRRTRLAEAVGLAEQVLKDPQADATLQEEAQKILRQAERAGQEIDKARQEAGKDREQAVSSLRVGDLAAARRHAERVLQNPYAEAGGKSEVEQVLRDLGPLEVAQALADKEEYAEALRAFDAAKAAIAAEGLAAEAAELLRQRVLEQRAKALHQAIERHLAVRAQRQRKSPDFKALPAAESLPEGSPAWLHEAVADLEALLQEYDARGRPAGKGDGLAPASLVADRFEVVECVRADAFGEMYRAKDRRGGRDVLLERLGTIEVPAARQEPLRRLVEALSGLAHPGLARLQAAEVAAGRLCVARDWAAGASLAEAKGLPARQVAEVLAAVGQALAHAHAQQVVHGDVRPAGVLLGDPPGGAVRLADPGTARLWALGRRQAYPQLCGTPGYIAPEVVVSLGEQAGPASDVFALGGVLYTVLSGKPPFAQPATGNGGGEANGAEILLRTLRYDLAPLAKAAPQAPEGLRRICERAMARDPQDRYADAGQFARDLQVFVLQLDGQEVQAALAGAQVLFDKRPRNQVPEIQTLAGAAAEAEKVQHLAEEAASRAGRAAEAAGAEPAVAAKGLLERATALRSVIREAQEGIGRSQAGAKKQLQAASEAVAAGRMREALAGAKGVLGNEYVPDLHPQAKQVEAAAASGLKRIGRKRLKVAGVAAAVMLVVGAGSYWWVNRPAAPPSKPREVAKVDKPPEPKAEPVPKTEPPKVEPTPKTEPPKVEPTPKTEPPVQLLFNVELVPSTSGPVNQSEPVTLVVTFPGGPATIDKPGNAGDLFGTEVTAGVKAKSIDWVEPDRGTYRFKIQGLQGDGKYKIWLKEQKAKDAAGKVNRASDPVSIVVDNTPPGKPKAPELQSPKSNPADGKVYVNSGDVVIGGGAPEGAVGAVLSCGKEVNAVSVTNLSYRVSLKGLKGGEYPVAVVAVDAAGNRSQPSDALTVVVDTGKPVVKLVQPTDQAKVDKPDVDVVAEVTEPNVQDVECLVAGRPAAKMTVGADGRWHHAVSLKDQANKLVEIRVTAADKAGNASEAVSLQVTYAEGWPAPGDAWWNAVWTELARAASEDRPWLKWAKGPASVDGKRATVTLDLPGEANRPKTTIDWADEFKADPNKVAATVAAGLLADAKSKSSAGGKASPLVRYVGSWEDRTKLEDTILAATAGAAEGIPLVLTDKAAAGRWLQEMARIKWMDSGAGSQAGLDARTKAVADELARRTNKVVANRFVEYFWGPSKVHVICWKTEGGVVGGPWYLCCGQSVDVREKIAPGVGTKAVPDLQDVSIGGSLVGWLARPEIKFFESGDTSFGIAIAPDGPLYFLPLSRVKFGRAVALELGALADMAAGAAIPAGVRGQPIQSLVDLCGPAPDLFRRRSAIWTCISGLGVPPKGAANSPAISLDVLQAGWYTWKGPSKLTPSPAEGGRIIGTVPKAYTDAVRQLAVRSGGAFITSTPFAGIVDPRVQPAPDDAWYAMFSDPVP